MWGLHLIQASLHCGCITFGQLSVLKPIMGTLRGSVQGIHILHLSFIPPPLYQRNQKLNICISNVLYSIQ